jgi:hypothetical protein
LLIECLSDLLPLDDLDLGDLDGRARAWRAPGVTARKEHEMQQD